MSGNPDIYGGVMSYQTDDGQHEGWEAAEFPDGRFSVGTGNGGVLVRYLDQPRDTEAEPGVLDGRTAIGWRGVCECGWRGPLWDRVTDHMEPGLSEHKVFDPAPSRFADVPAAIEEQIYQEWRGHLPPPPLPDVRAAAEDVRKAEARLNDAVARARADGSSWADIGDAAGITRQSAHERWSRR
jgi:hypothetical protein